MEQRAPPEYVLEVFADQTLVRDIVKGTRKGMLAAVLDSRLTLMHRPTAHHILPSILPKHTTLPPRATTSRYHIALYR